MIKQRAIAVTFVVETILIGACFCFLEKILSKKNQFETKDEETETLK